MTGAVAPLVPASPGRGPVDPERALRVAALRDRLDALERERVRRRPALAFGVDTLDRHLPGGGLAVGALHEVGEAGAAAEFAALATLFTASVLARLPGTVLWCVRHRDLFAPGLLTVGLAPGRVLFAETGRDADVLPTMEEGLRTRGLAAVVGEVSRLGLTASRRLQLAAEGTGVVALAIRRHRTRADAEAADGEPTAAATRWRIAPEPGTGPPSPGLPRARWRVELTRARGADAPVPGSWTRLMRRVVSVYLPTWATDLWRRRNPSRAPPWDRPLVVAAADGPRRVLVAVDRAARRLGLRPGQVVAHAQAAIVDLAVVEASPDADAEALLLLGAWCLRRYAPLIALDPPDGLFLDVAGAAHLHGGEARLLDDLVVRLGQRALAARAAVADTPGAAWAVARFSPREPVVAPGCQATAVAGLPVRALRIPRDLAAALAQLGIERVGQLAAKPRAPLRLRFGPEVSLRLDQAFGHAPEPLAYLAPPDVPSARLAFAEPISAPETLHRVTERLLTELAGVLERRGLGARRLDLLFARVDGVTQGVRVATARPTRTVAHILRLFAERLALVDPGFGIDAATLVASQVEWFDAAQGGLAGDGDRDGGADVAELVDRLTVRLGAGRVYRLGPVASGMPERSVRRLPPLALVPDAEWPAGLPRPARLLAPPERVTAVALAPDNPPALVVWRGTRLRVARADGPERVAGEWWVADDEAGLARDYYRIETTAGDRFWVFRDAPAAEGGRWWLHGVGEA